MNQDQPQTPQSTSSGTSDKSSVKLRKGGRKPVIPGDEKLLRGNELEETVAKLADEETDREIEAEDEFELGEPIIEDPEELSETEQNKRLLAQIKAETAKIENMKNEILEMRSGGGVATTLQTFHDQWAETAANHEGKSGFAMMEVEDAVFDQMTRAHKVKTDSFWYQGVRVFRKGRMEAILTEEGMNMNQKLFGSFKGGGKLVGRT